METSSELPPSSSSSQVKGEPTSASTPYLGTGASTNSSLLRFPAPNADQRISTWVESTAVANMSGHSEDGNNLNESTYEFIDTDTESRDDNATESIASTDFGRPEDVASLADTEGSGEDSEDDASESGPIPAFAALDQASENPFDTPTIGRSSTVIIDDVDRPLAHSIEFEEPFSLGSENVSVKHTVADFTEEETARIATDMQLKSQPRRLVMTIRQTMTKQGLSTRDPLRILYIGSHSAKTEIIRKLASTVTASVEGDKHTNHLHHSASQLYNVVQISEFGSERIPEIELMRSSGYQIKVEDCISAQSLMYEDSPEKPEVIKLSLEDNFSYHSVPDEEGFTVEPHWDLPHIAVFYCSDSDGGEAKRTRKVARKFMSRHNIPSILISHKHFFDHRGQFASLDQHSIHMCLESRDSNGRGNIIHQRLPIDLTSFLEIDARQMNRNLAYLTGLHEPLESTEAMAKKVDVQTTASTKPAKTSFTFSNSIGFIRNRHVTEWRALLPVSLLVMSVLAAVLTSIPTYRFSGAPTISINSKVLTNIPVSCKSSSPQSAIIQSITSAPSSIAVSTSTRTVTVTHAHAHAHSPGPNSLSVISPMDLGKASPKFQSQPKSTNKSVCSAEILSDREILIRIPSATKLSWLTKEAMSVNITRGNTTVDTERAYSSDDGIVLMLPKKEAYGVLNISIITTKKPRVNETFQIDLGTSAFQTWQNLIDNVPSIFSEEYSLINPFSGVRKMVKDAKTQSQSALKSVGEARKVVLQQAVSTTESFTDLAKSVSLEAAKRSAIISKEVGIQLSEAEAKLTEQIQTLRHVPDALSDGLLNAQIQSKLKWLKLQGKDEEYHQYEKAAAEAIRARGAGSRSADKATKRKAGMKNTEKGKRPGELKRKAGREAKKSVKKEARAAKKLRKIPKA